MSGGKIVNLKPGEKIKTGEETFIVIKKISKKEFPEEWIVRREKDGTYCLLVKRGNRIDFEDIYYIPRECNCIIEDIVKGKKEFDGKISLDENYKTAEVSGECIFKRIKKFLFG